MVARLLLAFVLSGGLNLSLSGLPILPAAQAGTGNGSAPTSATRRAQFRPVAPVAGPRVVNKPSARRGAAPSTHHRRSHASSRARRVFGASVLGDRAGARKAVPVTRAQELGLKFRPDERAGAYGRANPGPASASDANASELQSQFRPAPAKRRPTYEELQAGAGTDARPAPWAAPAPAYPPLPVPLLPGFGGPWPPR